MHIAATRHCCCSNQILLAHEVMSHADTVELESFTDLYQCLFVYAGLAGLMQGLAALHHRCSFPLRYSSLNPYVISSLQGWKIGHRLPIQAAGALPGGAAGTSSFGMVGLLRSCQYKLLFHLQLRQSPSFTKCICRAVSTPMPFLSSTPANRRQGPCPALCYCGCP